MNLGRTCSQRQHWKLDYRHIQYQEQLYEESEDRRRNKLRTLKWSQETNGVKEKERKCFSISYNRGTRNRDEPSRLRRILEFVNTPAASSASAGSDLQRSVTWISFGIVRPRYQKRLNLFLYSNYNVRRDYVNIAEFYEDLILIQCVFYRLPENFAMTETNYTIQDQIWERIITFLFLFNVDFSYFANYLL